MAPAKTQQANRRGTNRSKPENRVRPDAGKFDPKQSRIKRLTDWDQEDIQDEQDEFFEGLDKVSLQQTSRDAATENDLEIPEQLLDIDDGRSEDEQEFLPDDDSEAQSKPRKQRKLKAPVDNSHKGRFGKVRSTEDSNISEGALEASEKIHIDEQENKEGESDKSDGSDDDESAWKSYHVTKSKSKKKKPTTNDQEAIREEEERRALELEEVKRLQAKARSKLIPKDFSSYLDYASDEELAAEASKADAHQDSLDPSSLVVKEFHSEPEAIAYLLKNKPESLALLDDLRRSLDLLSALQEKLVSASSDPSADENQEKNQAIDMLHYQILSTYVAHTAFYMHLSLQVPPADPSLVSSVMKSLIDLRGTINLMEQYELIGDGMDSDLELGSDIFNGQFSRADFDEELRDLLSDQASDQGESIQISSTDKRPRSTRSEVNLSEHDTEATVSKSKRRKKAKTKEQDDISRFPQVEDPNLSLQNLPPRPSISSVLDGLSASQKDVNMVDADFVEPRSLTAQEKSEKAKKKKDLRFYTAKIQAKGKRREKALAGSAISGDSDLPYITKEAQRRDFLKNQDHQTNAELDDEGDLSGDETGHHDCQQHSSNADSSDYYNTIKELKLSAKKSKKTQYDQQKLAERDALTRSGEIDEDGGPRSVNRQILKNKGLTPKRAKENRNPRVKKRKRFEKAQQKISSQRPTFKPEQAAQNRSIAGYQGERTGVKVGLVKSRKL